MVLPSNRICTASRHSSSLLDLPRTEWMSGIETDVEFSILAYLDDTAISQSILASDRVSGLKAKTNTFCLARPDTEAREYRQA